MTGKGSSSTGGFRSKDSLLGKREDKISGVKEVTKGIIGKGKGRTGKFSVHYRWDGR